MPQNKHPISFLLFFLLIKVCTAQTSILERSLAINVVNEPLGDVLKFVSQKANFYLSYNANILDGNKKVSLKLDNSNVRTVYKSLLGNNFQFKQKGNYLIIQKLKPNEQIIGGYISDDKTGKKIPNATVYDRKSLASATTDSYGYYEILTRKPIEKLTVSRLNYGDTVLVLRSIEPQKALEIDVSLLQKGKIDTTERSNEPLNNIIKISDKEDTGDEYRERTLLSNGEISRSLGNIIKTFERINETNIEAPIKRTGHFSIAPYVGSNFGLSGSVINKWSFNTTVGYTNGNEGLEIGLLGNINKRDVKGIQLGGLFNIVNGSMKGFQVSSILNRTQRATGVQISLVTNSTDTLWRGWQFAGINNSADYAKRGAFQFAGIVNRHANGRMLMQAATVHNKADTVAAQFGFINKARHLKGLQIGLINIADTTSGVMLGLINIVKRGYHVLEASANDLTLGNVAYRTGTSWFYSIYHLGFSPNFSDKKSLLTMGGGIGTSIRFSKRVSLTLDATVHKPVVDNLISDSDWLWRATPALNIHLTPKIGIAVAPIFNAYNVNPLDELAIGRIVPTNAKINGNWRTWWGWTVAARFF
jgi:hypothetical protein